MKVLVTGAAGFVGRWFEAEMTAAGHIVESLPPSSVLDLGNYPDLTPRIQLSNPDAVVHLAAISSNPESQADPARAWHVNVGGTEALFAGLNAAASSAAVLLASSSEVYGNPEAADLPLKETAPLRATRPYGRSKVGQESVALRAADSGRAVLIARQFNHIGPGQRPVFVIPSLARRILAFRAGDVDAIAVGNLDVRRDFVDVRDAVRAYRLLLEKLVGGQLAAEERIVNIGSGRAMSIRRLAEILCGIAGVEPRFHVDPEAVRPDDAPEIVADTTLIRSLIPWECTVPIEMSLADVLARPMSGKD
jgi:GDP-4-dehydro-6-deoxy-D-mannose reductase